ncbi:hypothetical protein GGH99_007994 [Coemansia sp. RSA 1285]|nr:hypothetical protein GGH99_007994 [Coemansia sp. RSA 1285]
MMRTVLLLFLAGLCLGGCENPATFKKCVAQTRAEVNICGINMTCKCLRQENVVKCYEKCGEDDHYLKLKLGEQGQKQIFCSQKQPGEPEDLPIIGSDGPSFHDAKKQSKRPKKESPPSQQQQQQQAPPPPPPPPPSARKDDFGMQPVAGARGAGMAGGDSGNAGLVRNMDIDGAIAGARPGAAAAVVAMVGAIYAIA